MPEIWLTGISQPLNLAPSMPLAQVAHHQGFVQRLLLRKAGGVDRLEAAQELLGSGEVARRRLPRDVGELVVPALVAEDRGELRGLVERLYSHCSASSAAQGIAPRLERIRAEGGERQSRSDMVGMVRRDRKRMRSPCVLLSIQSKPPQVQKGGIHTSGYPFWAAIHASIRSSSTSMRQRAGAEHLVVERADVELGRRAPSGPSRAAPRIFSWPIL